jgi:hypothetical protein
VTSGRSVKILWNVMLFLIGVELAAKSHLRRFQAQNAIAEATVGRAFQSSRRRRAHHINSNTARNKLD